MTATAILSTVKPCKKCGASDRYSSGDCRPCHIDRSARKRKEQPEQVALQNARTRAKHIEKHKAKSALWREKNKEKKAASDLAWRTANVDRIKKTKSIYYEKNKEEIAKKTESWRSNNPEKVKKYNDKAYEKDCETIKKRSAIWAINNPEKIKSSSAKFRKDHPDLRIIWESNRRARKRASGGKLSEGITEKLFKLQKGKCACCKQKLGDDYHLDHVMPLALGGSNTDENMQLLRSECNLKKNAKHPVDFMQSRGFLL